MVSMPQFLCGSSYSVTQVNWSTKEALNLWDMSVPVSASWTIRKIFRLRTYVQPWITYVVGNGYNIFLWLDNWHPLGPLKTKFGSRFVYNLGRTINA